MDELKRRYLRQQIELGGSELVTSGQVRAEPRGSPASAPAAGQPTAPVPTSDSPPDRRPVAARSGTRDSEAPSTAPAPPRTEPRGGTASSGKASAAAGSAKDWRAGAPPVPGPGLVIEPPLFHDMPAEWTSLETIAQSIAGCTKCALAKGRTRTVPGEGNPDADLVLVGEGPGQTEDETGRPFVGRAGELLNGILAAIGYAREDVFICNVVKCRPPQNRKPLPDEMAACFPYLDAQLRLIRPKVILALGSTAAEALLKVKRSLSDLRGRVHSYQGTPLVVTYHPAALLRNPNWKKPTWDDVRIARQLVDR